MFSNVLKKRASRRYGRNVFLAVVFLLSILCFCNKTSTGPAANKCPLFPQKTTPLDVADPMIRVVSPNGGEVFHVSQQCTVKACSKYSLHDAGGGEIRIIIGGKAYTTQDYYPGPINVNSMLGDSAEFAQYGDSVVIANIFTIPDILYELGSNNTISSVSNECVIELRTYNPPYYPDTSDCYFSIVK